MYPNFKKKHPSCLDNLRYYILEYSQRASIHGLSYLCEKNRSFIERLWWLLIIALSLFLCTNLITKAYYKWEQSPIIVTFATSETPMRDIPFPAVTICPQVKTNTKKINITLLVEMYAAKNLTTEQERQLHYISVICSNTQTMAFEGIDKNDFDQNEASEFFMDVRPDFDDLVQSCNWAGIDCSTNVSAYFTPMLTTEGVCFSFNMLDRDKVFTDNMQKSHFNNISKPSVLTSNWSLETGYPNTDPVFAVPRRIRSSGVVGGLDIVLKTNSFEMDNICGDLVQGYKVIIHYPSQLPNTNKFFFYLGLNQVVLSTVKPNFVKTPRELKMYSPKDRRCFFVEEKTLKYFNIYDQQNCLLECMSNFTYQYCNCVGFLCLVSDPLMGVCGLNSYGCLKQARAKFFMNFADLETVYGTIQCDCLPTCNSLDFETEISESYWDWAQTSKKTAFIYNLNEKERLSRLRVYFKDMQFLALERSELYGQTDFLASCGGLLGLFIGFSLISVVEIVYYSTLKIMCNIVKYGHHYWSGAEELLQ